jgi:hypothetical protein
MNSLLHLAQYAWLVLLCFATAAAGEWAFGVRFDAFDIIACAALARTVKV